MTDDRLRRGGRGPRRNLERDREISRRFHAGENPRILGEEFELSRQRIFQIARYEGNGNLSRYERSKRRR